MSELCGFPEDMITEARELQKIIKNLFPVLLPSLNDSEIDSSAILFVKLLQQLLLLRDSSLDDNGLFSYLHRLRTKISDKEIEYLKLYLNDNESLEKKSKADENKYDIQIDDDDYNESNTTIKKITNFHRQRVSMSLDQRDDDIFREKDSTSESRPTHEQVQAKYEHNSDQIIKTLNASLPGSNHRSCRKQSDVESEIFVDDVESINQEISIKNNTEAVIFSKISSAGRISPINKNNIDSLGFQNAVAIESNTTNTTSFTKMADSSEFCDEINLQSSTNNISETKYKAHPLKQSRPFLVPKFSSRPQKIFSSESNQERSEKYSDEKLKRKSTRCQTSDRNSPVQKQSKNDEH
jgi:hypothetical protein